MPGDLTFRATVEAVEVAPVGMAGGFLDWVVRTRVIEVLSGDFTHATFAFRIHSPARSGLKVGVTCTIFAEWTGAGYRIDENQWSGNPR